MKKRNYCAMFIACYKAGSIGNINSHNERFEGCYERNKRIDPKRKELNYHLKTPSERYMETIHEKLENAGVKTRKNSNLMVEVVISATKDWINALDIKAQKEYLEYAYEFVVKRFGDDRILSAVAHFDEEFPHLHVCMVPLTENNRLNSADFFGGDYSLAIDEFCDHVSKKYTDLHRGLPSSRTQRKVIPLHLYRSIEDIYEQHREICEEVMDINMLNIASQKTIVLKDLQKFIENLAKISYIVKSTDEHIRNMESMNIELKSGLEQEKIRNNELKLKYYELTDKFEKTETKIDELIKENEHLSKMIGMIDPDIMKIVNEKISAKTLTEKNEKASKTFQTAREKYSPEIYC